MAEASKTPSKANPVPNEGDHDRVQMLSLKADGTPDQHNPEIIGDKEAAVAAAKVQFAQQAVSAVDVAYADPSRVTIVGTPEGEPDKVVPLHHGQDPSIEKAQAEHEKVAETAAKAAAATVEALSKS